MDGFESSKRLGEAIFDVGVQVWKYVYREAIHAIWRSRNSTVFGRLEVDIPIDILVSYVLEKVEDSVRIHNL